MVINGTQSKKIINYIHNAANFLELYKLDVFIEIDFVKKCDGNAAGYCHGDDYVIYIEIARHDSRGKIPTDLLLINVAHELIHAKQIATGKLMDVGFTKNRSPKWKWHGKTLVDIDYNDRPWEKEAYKLEEIVYHACIKE